MVDSSPIAEALHRLHSAKERLGADIADHEATIAKHQEAIAALRTALADYETTERVLLTLDEPLSDEPVVGGDIPGNGVDHGEAEPVGKPTGTPSIPEMVRIALTDHLTNIAEPKEITRRIRERWWPDAPTARISVVVWKMAQDGRLKKNGNGGYSVVPSFGGLTP